VQGEKKVKNEGRVGRLVARFGEREHPRRHRPPAKRVWVYRPMRLQLVRPVFENYWLRLARIPEAVGQEEPLRRKNSYAHAIPHEVAHAAAHEPPDCPAYAETH